MELKINTSYLGCYSNNDNLSTTYSNIKYETEINPNFLKEKTIKDNYTECKLIENNCDDENNIKGYNKKVKEFVPSNFDIEKAIKYYFIRLFTNKISDEDFRLTMSKLLKLYPNRKFNNKLYTHGFFEKLQIPEDKKILVNNYLFNRIVNHNRTDNHYSNNRQLILGLINLKNLFKLNETKIFNENYNFDSIHIDFYNSIDYPGLDNESESDESYENNIFYNHTYFYNTKLPLKFIKLATLYYNNNISKKRFYELLNSESDEIYFDSSYSNNKLMIMSSKILMLSLLISNYDKTLITFDELVDKAIDYLDNKLSEKEIADESIKRVLANCDFTKIILKDGETNIERKKLMICTQWKLFIENQFQLNEFIDRIKLIMANQIIYNNFENDFIKANDKKCNNTCYGFYYRDSDLNYNFTKKNIKTIRIIVDNLYDGKYTFEDFIYLICALVTDNLDINQVLKMDLDNTKNFYQGVNNLLDNIKQAQDDKNNKDKLDDYILPDNEINNILKEKAEKYNKILDLIKKNFYNYKTLIGNEDFYKNGEEETK